MWRQAYLSALLVLLGGLVFGLAYVQASDGGDEGPWRVPIGTNTWSLAARDKLAVLIRVRGPSTDNTDARVKAHIVRLEYALADIGKPIPTTGLQWRMVGQLYTLAPESSVVSGMLRPAPSSVLTVAVETTMGARSIKWTTLDLKKPGELAAVPPDEGMEGRILELKRAAVSANFAIINRVDYAGAPEGFFLSDLSHPCVAYGKETTYLAAEAGYPKEHVRGIWVAQLDTGKRVITRADLLGQGRSPALVGAGDQMLCVGLAASQSKKNETPFVGWKCRNGKWEAWDLRLQMEGKPISVDLLVLDSALFLAAQTREGRIRIWKTDVAKETSAWDLILNEKHPPSTGRIQIRAGDNGLLYFIDEEVRSGERNLVARQVTKPATDLEVVRPATDLGAPPKQEKSETIQGGVQVNQNKNWTWLVGTAVAATVLVIVIILLLRHTRRRGAGANMGK